MVRTVEIYQRSPHVSKHKFLSFTNKSAVVKCYRIGIGNVQLQVSDDTIKTLTNERHVPCLKRNLIYVGMLNEYGMICKTKKWCYENCERFYYSYERNKEKWFVCFVLYLVKLSCGTRGWVT